MADLAQDMTNQGCHPGIAAMDATAIMSSLAETIRIAIEARTGPGGTSQLNHVVELANPHWAPIDHGIEHLGPPTYTIEGRELQNQARRDSVRVRLDCPRGRRLRAGMGSRPGVPPPWRPEPRSRPGAAVRPSLNRHRAPLEPTWRDPTASERRG